MKKAFTKVLSIILSLAVIITGLPLIGVDLSTTVNAKTLSEYEVGDIIEFGSYPQSEVTDESLLQELNSLTLNWVSYEYYTGTGDVVDGKMQPSDYMKYSDVTYNNSKYRAVTFTQYRPDHTGKVSSADASFQDDNGYYTDTVYWFKYEPLKWIVLDPDEGFILCESIIDSQAFNNTVYYKHLYHPYFYQNSSRKIYASNYAASSVREWLNNDFYNTAFDDTEKAEIKNSVQENIAISGSTRFPEYDSVTTNDKIFIPSYLEMTNVDYGFSSTSSSCESREAQGTDYAKCQGIQVSTNVYYYGNSRYFLRTSLSSATAEVIEVDGKISHSYVHTTQFYGVRPALKFNPESDSSIIKAVSSQIRFDRNEDNTYAGTFDVRTRVTISDEDFNTFIGATNEDAINNIKKAGFVYSINPETFSTYDAKTVAMGGEFAGYTDAPVKYIQDADGYYMFTCLVTDIPSTDTNYTLVSYAYICVEDADGNENWYFMETQAEADFNSLYATYYPIACEKYGWE